MSARTLAGAALVLLLLMAMVELPNSPRASASPDENRSVVGSPPPAEGDWEVDVDTVVTDADVVIQGNIAVREGCELRLVDSNLTMRDAETHSYVLVLEEGATLSIQHSALLLDVLDGHEGSSLRVFHGSIETGGSFLARCHLVEVDGGELTCRAPSAIHDESGDDAVMVLDGRDGPGLIKSSIVVLGGSAGTSSPGENGTAGSCSSLLSNVTDWVDCTVEVRAGDAGSGGLGLPGVSGGDGGPGGDAEAHLQPDRIERTSIAVIGSTGGYGAGGADHNGGDAGDGGDGAPGGSARLSLTSLASIKMLDCRLIVESGDGGSGGNGGTAEDGDGGDGGASAQGGPAILEVSVSKDLSIEGSELECTGGDGGYGGDFGRVSSGAGEPGFPRVGGSGYEANVSMTCPGVLSLSHSEVSVVGGEGSDGGSGYDQGARGGDGGNASTALSAGGDIEMTWANLVATGGRGGNGGPAVSDISGNGGDGGHEWLIIISSGAISIQRSDLQVNPGWGGRGNSVVWDGKPSIPDLDLETQLLVAHNCTFNAALDDLSGNARGYLYNCTFDVPLPVILRDDAEVWFYYPVDIWVTNRYNPPDTRGLVDHEVQVVSAPPGSIEAIRRTDERGLVSLMLPSWHITSTSQEYMGQYIVTVTAPEGWAKRAVRMDVQGSMQWPHPFLFEFNIRPDWRDIFIDKPSGGSALTLTPLASAVEVSGHIIVVSDRFPLTKVRVILFPTDDDPKDWPNISLQLSDVPLSNLTDDGDKWGRFFEPDEYSNKWRFFCRFEVLGSASPRNYTDGYYDIIVQASDESGSDVGRVQVWLNIVRYVDAVPTVSLSTDPKGIDWNTTETVVLSGTAWDDSRVVSVELRVDDGPWVRANGTTEWNYTLDLETIPDGFHTFYLRSSDGSNLSPEMRWSVSINRPEDNGNGDGSGVGLPAIPLVIGLVLIGVLLVLAVLAMRLGRRAKRID